jgi:hypothetical protein
MAKAHLAKGKVSKKKNGRKKTTHTIRTDFRFNLLRSASKLKRGVIKWTGGLFWFSVIVDFSSPIFFWIFYVP